MLHSVWQSLYEDAIFFFFRVGFLYLPLPGGLGGNGLITFPAQHHDFRSGLLSAFSFWTADYIAEIKSD